MDTEKIENQPDVDGETENVVEAEQETDEETKPEGDSDSLSDQVAVALDEIFEAVDEKGDADDEEEAEQSENVSAKLPDEEEAETATASAEDDASPWPDDVQIQKTSKERGDGSVEDSEIEFRFVDRPKSERSTVREMYVFKTQKTRKRQPVPSHLRWKQRLAEGHH